VKVTLESTTSIVELEVEGGVVPGRLWEGVTESGIRVVALITRIAAETGVGPDTHAEFRRELEECRPPTIAGVFPARLVL
jgi:hypothetical protein